MVSLFLFVGNVWRKMVPHVFILLWSPFAFGVSECGNARVEVPGRILLAERMDAQRGLVPIRAYIKVDYSGRIYNAILDTGYPFYFEVASKSEVNDCLVKIEGIMAMDECARVRPSISSIDSFGGDAVLGLPFLRKMGRVRLSFKPAGVYFRGCPDENERMYAKQGLKYQRGRLSVSMVVNGKKIRALVDTGMSDSLRFVDPDICVSNRRSRVRSFETIYSSKRMIVVECDVRARLGGAEFNVVGYNVDRESYLESYPSSRESLLPNLFGYDAIVGMGFFSGFSAVEIDFDSMLIEIYD